MYANEALKRIIVCVAGCKGFAETLLETDYPKLAPVNGELMAMRDCAERVLQECERGLDADQVKGLVRYANDHEIVVISKACPKAAKDYYTVSQDALDYLLQDVVSDCAFCGKDEKERKRCKRRKCMLECGIIGDGNDKDCPYYGL